MIVRCSNCGADVEFRYDDSFVRVCDHCRSAVVRTDRGVDTLGMFADLVPIQSALQLFAEGRYGTTGFLLIGMAQLRHAAGGVWQEWYAKLDGGQWAWISEAQGRLYLTFERTDIAAPPLAAIAALAPGAQLQLAGKIFTVAERGTATYASASGEIPYRLVPNSTFQFVDLSDGQGGFATIASPGSAGARSNAERCGVSIDYSELPTVYLGYQVTPEELGIHGGEAQPPRVTPGSGARLACPNCHGALELRAPDQALRVVCPYCNHLVSVESGTLSIIAKLATRARPPIALGTQATFVDGELTVIGYVGRSAYVAESWWPFEEYLLYAPGVGFRWLVCSDGHWSYVQPVAAGAVTVDVQAHYDGVTFKRFQTAALRVDSVLGEFYWRVQAGEQVSSNDYIAPPAMLSREATRDEETWSLSSYLTTREVERAFGQRLGLSAPVGVGANQPYPGGVGKVIALVTTLLFALGIAKCASAPDAEKLRWQLATPPAGSINTPNSPAVSDVAPAEPPGAVMFSDKFRLDGGRNVAFDLSADVSNNWLYAALDLVNEDTGGVVSFDTSIEYYAGYDSDGSWSEGSQTARQVIGPVEPGMYLLRVEAQHGGTGDVGFRVVVHQGVFRWLWFLIALGVLAIPFGGVAAHASAFRRKRWENANAEDGSWGMEI